MLTIKCAKCKAKIMKYKKIGSGRVLRCYKERITRVYDGRMERDKLKCQNCGNIIGLLKGSYIEMNSDAFIYSGRKINN